MLAFYYCWLYEKWIPNSIQIDLLWYVFLWLISIRLMQRVALLCQYAVEFLMTVTPIKHDCANSVQCSYPVCKIKKKT